MIQNSEEYKLISIDSLDFSVRLTNAAHRNGIATLYELVESYNSGEFEKMRNVGTSTIQELLNLDFLTAVVPEEESVPDIEAVNIDEILPTEFLDSDIDKYVYDISLFNHFRRHDVKIVRDILGLAAVDMMAWQQFGKVKVDTVLEFQRRSLEGEICFILGSGVKKPDEIEASRELDPKVLEILKNEYGLKYTWLCEWFGVSRQMVDQKVKKAKRNRDGKWDGFSYTDEEELAIIEMLKNKQSKFNEGSVFYYFLKNANGNIALLFVNEESIRCFFEEDIKGNLKEYIHSNRLNELDFRELEIGVNGSEVSLLRTIYFVPAREDLSDFSAYAKKHGMTKEEYGIFLTGKPYANDFIITDEKICRFFDEHLNENGKVYISADPSNQWIKSYASRKGYRISEFIEFYGYQSALAGDMLTAEGARKRHLETIKNYIVRDNVVYVPTYCDFYRILNSYSARRGMTISEYVSELGYERTLTPDEFSGTTFNDYEAFDVDETDMEVHSSDGSFLEKVFAANPLLGNSLLSENNMQVLHNKAKKVIDELVANHGYKLNKEQKMSVALSVINYAKYWDTGLGTFTNYITKQYGYRSEDRVYPRIVSATFEALTESGRWTFSLHGSNQYKSTVMIHAMGSIRSWMHLCDFLSDFYQNNLGCHYVEDDPYILSMVMYMRSLFYNSEVGNEDDNDVEIRVGSKPYRFQEGIRKLVVYRPNYAAKVFDRMIKRIHAYMSATVTPAKKYEDTLVDLWFKNKTEYYFQFKRNVGKTVTPVSHRIAFDYTHIRLDYKFNDNQLWLEIPDIRLTANSTGTCFFELYDKDALIERRSLKCYGNELGRTIAGFTYSLYDYISVLDSDEICPRVLIKAGETVIYDSGLKLKRRTIAFSGEREKELSSAEVGGYVVVVPLDIDISGTSVETSVIRTVQGYKYLFVDLQDDFSLVVDDIIVSFDRKKAEKIRVNLPHYVKGAKYVEDGLEYSICKSNGEISIIVDENDIEQKYVILLNGKQIAFSDLKHNAGEGLNVYTMPLQAWDREKNRLQIVDFSCNKIVVDKWFIFIPAFSFSFDSEFYFTDKEIQECCLEYVINEDEYEITNDGSDSCLTAEYENGVIEFEIPKVRLVDLEGKLWENRELFVDEIDRGLYLKLFTVSGIEGNLFIGSTEIQRDVMGLFAFGNTIYSLMAPKTEVIKLVLKNLQGESKSYKLGKVIFKEQFISEPKVEYIEGKLMWDCGYGFIGNTTKDTYIRVSDGKGNTIYEEKLDLNSTLIAESISFDDGEYRYAIYRESADLFSLEENDLAQGVFVCGNYDRIRFNGSKIVIPQIVFDNAVSTGVVNIMTAYIDGIKYDEKLSSEEGSEGICPTYSGTMYFINPEGKRHDYSFENEQRSENDIRVKTNPVKIVYINDSVLLVTDCDGDALMFRFYYDRYTHEKIYHITDHEQSKFDHDNYDFVDLLRYRTESL
jgi:hypothetical protein